jgi:hypothetical protein
MAMDVVIASEAPIIEQRSVRPGATVRQVLLMDDAPDGLNYRLFRSHYQSGDQAFQSPRHHHAFQQIRWAESESINYGPGQTIAEGDLAYFPKGAYYGPQKKDRGVSLLLQLGFHGDHQSGERWEGLRRKEAIERLTARGTLENGEFIETDPATGERRPIDAAQALYEERYAMHTNKRFVVPPARYEAPILMHAQAFEYCRAAPGVEVKRLGAFYDYPGPNADIRLSMLRLGERGVYRLGPERAQLGWARSAGLLIDGRSYPEMTCFSSRRGEELTIAGVDGVEIYLVELPRLD